MARNLWSCARPHDLRRFSQLHPTREAFHEIQRPPSQHPLAGIPELSARASVQERTGCTPTGGELMFTGIIQTVGRVVRLEPRGGDVRLHVDTADLDLTDVQPGDSIAVSGVCLTAITLDAHGFSADVSNETLSLTSLRSEEHTSELQSPLNIVC